VLPGLLVGIPALTILIILASQVGAAAAFVPAIRRWLKTTSAAGRATASDRSGAPANPSKN
jgi:hypothetical protein